MERWAEDVAESMGFAEVEHTVELKGVCGRGRVTPTAQGSTEQHAERRLTPGR
nr:hypothetical protein [Streptomyces spinoverrucosus]